MKTGDMKVIAMGADHAGYFYKEKIKEFLQKNDYEVLDFGTDSPESVDYPDFIHPVAQAIEDGKAEAGIIICGSGNGVAITANKHRHIRAALCWNKELAKLARAHNNANVLALPARFIALEWAIDITETFIQSDFEGGRHERRVKKISDF